MPNPQTFDHSSEPWRFYDIAPPHSEYAVIYRHKEGTDEDTSGSPRIVVVGPRACADARRIVACVNACKGLDDEDLSELTRGASCRPDVRFLEAMRRVHDSLRSLQKYLDPERDGGHVHGINAFQRLGDALKGLVAQTSPKKK